MNISDGNKYYEALKEIIPHEKYESNSHFVSFTNEGYEITIFWEMYANIDRISIKFIKENKVFYIDHLMRDDREDKNYKSILSIEIQEQIEYLVNNFMNITNYQWVQETSLMSEKKGNEALKELFK